jgi:tetratricopeptide (TPR) repeat protein
MPKAFAVLLAALVAGLCAATTHAALQVLFGNWTFGTIERFLTDPDISQEPIGYQPPDLLALQRQLLDGRHAALDAHFAELQREYLSGARPEAEYTLSYKAFQTTNPEIGFALDRWVAVRQDSAAALAARAMFLMHRAWWIGDYAQPGPGPMQKGTDWKPDFETYVAARRDLESAVALDRRNMSALSALIWVEIGIGDNAVDPGLLERGRAVDPLSFALHRAWLAGLLDGPDGVRAAQKYIDSIRAEIADESLLKRLNAQISEHRARKLMEQGEIEQAIDLLFEAGAIAEWAYLLHYRASLLRKTGADDWAEADLDRTYRYLPHLTRILSERAELYAETGRTELAEREFALALQLDPMNTRTLWSRYRMLDVEKRYREAEASLTTAMQLRASGGWLGFERGRLRLTKLDDASGAAEDLAAVAANYSDSPNVWQLYARALTETDDCRAVEALAQYRRACEVTESKECRGSTLRAEARRVEKMAVRLACVPSG